MTSPNHASVTCIIPAYNSQRFIEETLESVLAQTHPVHEIYVVDDGSTDATRAVVEACAGKFPGKTSGGIHYLWQENGGSAAARNYGIQKSNGEYIAFLDADDLWQPEKIARQLARFAARPELGISVTHIQNFWMDEVHEEKERLGDHPRAKPMAGYCMSTLMTRRTVLAQIGTLDSSLHFSDDTEWFMRAKDAQVIDELMPDVLVMRRMHLHNFSRLQAKASQAEYLRLLKTRTRRSSVQAETRT